MPTPRKPSPQGQGEVPTRRSRQPPPERNLPRRRPTEFFHKLSSSSSRDRCRRREPRRPHPLYQINRRSHRYQGESHRMTQREPGSHNEFETPLPSAAPCSPERSPAHHLLLTPGASHEAPQSGQAPAERRIGGAGVTRLAPSPDSSARSHQAQPPILAMPPRGSR